MLGLRSDLGSGSGSGGLNDYYQSLREMKIEDVIVPRGAYFRLTGFKHEEPYSSSPVFEDHVNGPEDIWMRGSRVCMTTLSPQTGSSISCWYWYSSPNIDLFKRITNEMTIIAIATTGL